MNTWKNTFVVGDRGFFASLLEVSYPNPASRAYPNPAVTARDLANDYDTYLEEKARAFEYETYGYIDADNHIKPTYAEAVERGLT